MTKTTDFEAILYEVEDGILSGGVSVDTAVPGYTGTGYVTYPGSTGAGGSGFGLGFSEGVEFSVTLAALSDASELVSIGALAAFFSIASMIFLR